MENLAKCPIGPVRERVLTDSELTAALESHTPCHRRVVFLILSDYARPRRPASDGHFFGEAPRTLTIPGDLTKNERTHLILYGRRLCDFGLQRRLARSRVAGRSHTAS
jgi:hypothetical protein